MIPLNDNRWKTFEGGYRVKYDALVPLSRLEGSSDSLEPIWSELWEELYHQGDVGIASYAAIPHIARITFARSLLDWNPFALAVTVELASGKDQNPDVPDWLIEDYDQALRSLAAYAAENIDREWDEELLQSVLALVAIIKGSRNLAELIFEVSDGEAKDALEKFFDS